MIKGQDHSDLSFILYYSQRSRHANDSVESQVPLNVVLWQRYQKKHFEHKKIMSKYPNFVLFFLSLLIFGQVFFSVYVMQSFTMALIHLIAVFRSV